MKKILLFTFCFLLFTSSLLAQEEEKEKKLVFDGYLSGMQNFQFAEIDEDWLIDNQFHNRLNFNYYANEFLTFSAQFRNRFMYGDNIRLNPNYGDNFETDLGFFDLSSNILEEKSFLLNTQVDRIYMNFEKNKLSLRIGRQRINWGRTFAWNPNDIFNAYSFFDFDYVERAGSDAIRLQYYTSDVSNIDLAVKLNNDTNITAAALFHFNKWNYDWQILGGIYNQNDVVLGAGWAGNIKSLSFRGEMSYFRDKDNFLDTTGIFVSSLSFDYMLPNELMLQAEILYSKKNNNNIANIMEQFAGTVTAKNLSISEWNAFVSMQYPVTPLLSASLSGMYFFDQKGIFLGPSIDYSVKENLDFSFVTQFFTLKTALEPNLPKERVNYFFGFLRLKRSF